VPAFAADDNFGEEDDLGNVDSVETEATTPDQTESPVTQPESDAQTNATTEQKTEPETTRAQAVRPPVEQPQWSLPIPVIWGLIVGLGVFGLAAAIFLFVKFAKGT
jgi:hypothetical protein